MTGLPHKVQLITAGILLALTACGDGAPERSEADIPAGAPTDTPSALPSTPPAAARVSSAGALLDPNQASREELLMVPGITPALADALIGGRPYEDMRGVDRVLAGQMSEEQRDSAYTRVWKPLDLNAASGEEIELIPRIGPRMRHEFEEYRPYRNIEQFRREIGKYVDETEVARLERYVALP